MCFKVGTDELGTVRGLIIMSLATILADVLDVDPDTLEAEMRLVEDLGMTPLQANAIRSGIAEHFDGLAIDLDETPTMGKLLGYVVEVAMEDQAVTE